jgi:hypothetical protein
MKHDVRAGHRAVDRFSVGDVAADERHRKACDVGDAVEAADERADVRATIDRQPRHELPADKAGGAGDEHAFAPELRERHASTASVRRAARGASHG